MRTTNSNHITPEQQKVLNIIDEYGPAEMHKALRLTLDATLFGYEVVLDKRTREELFYVKELVDAIEGVAKEL